jgi:hypothetical protein
VVQPPAASLGQVLIKGSRRLGRLEAGLLNCSENGLRMGLLYDIVCALVCRDNNPYGFVMCYRPPLPGQDAFCSDQSVEKAIDRLGEGGKATSIVLHVGSSESVGRPFDQHRGGNQGKMTGPMRINWSALKCVEYRKLKIETKGRFSRGSE